ncbi:MAG: SH3 domain-containing protein [Anaerolineaceae bacterium]|jgi:hypothetical protein|nr:MAG: SH3 domain-containing protein [Anaerolineaceae bacterium]
MLRLKRIMPLLMLIVAALACVIPGISLPGADVISTQAAETIIAGLTQSVTDTSLPSVIPSATMTFTPTLIYPTPRVPSETPTSTILPDIPTLTPELIATFTPGPVEIRVTRPTHCRSGPGKAYEIVGSMLVGMSAPVIGRDPTGEYWYISNPYVFTEYCWVWGEYAVFDGDHLLLPVVTPPPTPTSTATTAPVIDFKLEKQGMHSCSGAYWMNVVITSESNDVLNSINIVMRDTVKGVTRSVTYNNFPVTNGCEGLTWVETVPGGGAVTVTGPRFDYNIRGNKMQVTVTVCSEKDLKGACGMRATNLKP